MNFLKLLENTGLIAAHRGVHTECGENTMCALKASIDLCDFIEIDVQLSKDAKPVIIHDETLDRTTNKKGLVSSHTLEDLKEVLTLEDALRFAKENGQYINVEIKDIHKYFRDSLVVDIVIDAIDAIGVEDRVLISSFRSEYLPLCKKKLNIPTALLVEDKHPKDLLDFLKKLGVDGYHINDELADAKVVKELRGAGYFVNVYTVDDNKRAKKLFDMGVNGIFTNLDLKGS